MEGRGPPPLWGVPAPFGGRLPKGRGTPNPPKRREEGQMGATLRRARGSHPLWRTSAEGAGNPSYEGVVHPSLLERIFNNKRLHWLIYFTLHMLYSICYMPHTTHYILYTIYCPYCTLYTIYNVLCTLVYTVYCAYYSMYTMYNVLYILHIAHTMYCTCYILHILYTIYSTYNIYYIPYAAPVVGQGGVGFAAAVGVAVVGCG